MWGGFCRVIFRSVDVDGGTDIVVVLMMVLDL